MRIKLLKDIEDKYYNVKYNKDQVVPVLTTYMYDPDSDRKIIKCFGFGSYLYVDKEDYELV